MRIDLRRARRPVVLALLAGALVSADLAAQASTLCAGYPAATGAVCTAAIGGSRLLVPALGILISGGNPAIGAVRGSGPLSGVGATVRVDVTRIALPSLGYDGSSSTVPAQKTITAFAPMFEASVAVYDGNAHGAFAVDLLGSAQLLPTGNVADVHLDRDALRFGKTSVGVGIGARVTLIPEGSALPALTVSVMRRGVPRLGFGSVAAGDRYAFVLGMHAINYRATLAKRFGPLMIGAGAGYDRYSGTASVAFQQPLAVDPQAPPAFAIHDDRLIGFVDGGLRLGRFHLIGEAGVQRGADLRLGLDFTDNNSNDQRRFGSLGLRLGF